MERKETDAVLKSRIAALEQANKTLREAASFRSTIIDRAAEGLCVCHSIEEYPFIRFTVWNDRMTEITGYTFEEINRLGWYQTLYPDPEVQRRIQESMARMRNGDHLNGEEWVITRADGALRTLLISTSAVLHHGRFHSLVVMQDITERKEAEVALREAEERWNFALESSGDGVWDWNMVTGKVFYSRRWKELFGYGEDEISSDLEEWHRRVHPDDRKQVCLQLEKHLSGQAPFYMSEHRMLCKDGTYRWTLDRGKVIARSADGQALRIIGTQTDITERRHTEERLKLAAAVYEHSREAIFVTDANAKLLLANRAFTAITGYRCAELKGKTPEFLNPEWHDRTACQALCDHLKKAGHWQGEIWNRRKSGELYPAWLAISVLKDDASEVTHYIGIFSDISERKQADEKIQLLAYYDSLTQLPNRALLQDRLTQAMFAADHNGNKVAILCLDIDRFKNINDSLGQGIGDTCLKAVGQRITAATGQENTVARLGGDEFLIGVPDMKAIDDAARLAEQIMTLLGAPFVVSGHELNLTASIGISIYPDDGSDIDSLIRNADSAMYHAKEMGRNNYQFYTAEIQQRAFEALATENRLRRALEWNEFVLHFQPQVDLRSGRIVGMEALIRWRHPERGLLAPAQFIPIAEERGLIVAIGDWVLRAACAQNRAWQEAGLPALPVSINLSAVQFRQKELPDKVTRILTETGLEARWLELEITESALMPQTEMTTALMAQLKAMGLQLAVDDFGTGYSSLSYLKRFPIHKLKIDYSFVRDIPSDSDNRAIASAIIVMAKSLKIKVIAEGVETPEQLAFLAAQQCDEIQGFYCSKPLPAGEFGELLQGEGRLLKG